MGRNVYQAQAHFADETQNLWLEGVLVVVEEGVLITKQAHASGKKIATWDHQNSIPFQ